MRFLDAFGYELADLGHADTLADMYIFLAANWSTTGIPSTLTATRKMLRREAYDVVLPTHAQDAKDVLTALLKICAPRDRVRPAKPLILNDTKLFLPTGWSNTKRTNSQLALGTPLEQVEAWLAGVLFIRFDLLRPKELALLMLSDIEIKTAQVAPYIMLGQSGRRSSQAPKRRTRYLQVTVNTTKTSCVKLPPASLVQREDVFCPVAAFKAVVAVRRSLFPEQSPHAETHVLSTFGKSTQSKQSRLTRQLRQRITPGIDRSVTEKEFSLYSLRRGGVTDLVAAGVDERLIQALGRWKSRISLDAYFAAYSPDLQLMATVRLAAVSRINKWAKAQERRALRKRKRRRYN